MKTIALTTRIKSGWKIMEIIATINMLILLAKLKLRFHNKLNPIK